VAEQDDRHRVRGTQLAQHVVTGQVRQVLVDEHEVGARLGDPGQRAGAVRRSDDAEPCATQRQRDELGALDACVGDEGEGLSAHQSALAR
jgi:hypothetical protein